MAELALTITEQNKLAECEAVIERGLKTFIDVGNALLEIRDSRLYRGEFGTFDDYCRDRWGFSKPRATQLIQAAQVIDTLQNGNNCYQIPVNEAQARPLTSLPPDEQIRVWQQAVDTAPITGITAAHVQNVVNQFKQEPPIIESKPHVSFNSGNNEWYTPPEYIEAAWRVMGTIDLDPASSKIANQTVKAGVYFTSEDDGLRFHWDGHVWMNPPYAGELIGKFADKLVQHFASGDVKEAIVLVNNSTETVWFGAMMGIASAVVFPRGRVRFLDPDGNPGAPLQGQAVIYFGENVDLFASEFAQFGRVLCPMMTCGG